MLTAFFWDTVALAMGFFSTAFLVGGIYKIGQLQRERTASERTMYRTLWTNLSRVQNQLYELESKADSPAN